VKLQYCFSTLAERWQLMPITMDSRRLCCLYYIKCEKWSCHFIYENYITRCFDQRANKLRSNTSV